MFGTSQVLCQIALVEYLDHRLLRKYDAYRSLLYTVPRYDHLFYHDALSRLISGCVARFPVAF